MGFSAVKSQMVHLLFCPGISPGGKSPMGILLGSEGNPIAIGSSPGRGMRGGGGRRPLESPAAAIMGQKGDISPLFMGGGGGGGPGTVRCGKMTLCPGGLLSRFWLRGPRGGPLLETSSKSPDPSVGREPSAFRTVAGLWLYFFKCNFKL